MLFVECKKDGVGTVEWVDTFLDVDTKLLDDDDGKAAIEDDAVKAGGSNPGTGLNENG